MNENKATRYHRLKRRASIASAAVTATLLASLSASGVLVWTRSLVEASAARLVSRADARPFVVVTVVVAIVALASELAILPIAYYRGHVLDRRYGLTVSGAGRWALDHGRATALGLGVALAAGNIVYALMREWPLWWWLPAAAILSALAIGLAFVAPLVVLPLFYRFVPLARAALSERLLQLARRAGARVIGVYEWKLGDKSRAANAALVGMGRTRRIIVSDTLLAEYSDEEIEVILAHELAHHVHGDIWKAIAIEAGIVLATLILAHAALLTAGPWLGLRAVSDPAGVPVILLAAGVCSTLLSPLTNGVSRAHERHADRFALDLTANPEAFVSAMRRLSSQNLADEHPSRLSEVFFQSHPSIPERIANARAWQPATRAEADGAAAP